MSLITFKTFLDLKLDANVRIYNNQSDGHLEFDICAMNLDIFTHKNEVLLPWVF